MGGPAPYNLEVPEYSSSRTISSSSARRFRENENYQDSRFFLHLLDSSRLVNLPSHRPLPSFHLSLSLVRPSRASHTRRPPNGRGAGEGGMRTRACHLHLFGNAPPSLSLSHVHSSLFLQTLKVNQTKSS